MRIFPARLGPLCSFFFGLLLLPGAASAGGLDQLSEPLKTGAKAPADAAVVIGAEDYLRVADVPFARRDAALFYDWLIYSRGVRPEAVRLLDHEVTRESMQAAIETAARQVGAGGRLWVYFAGHGAAAPESGERLWLGDDVVGTPASFTARGLPVAAVHALAQTAGVDAIVLSDACYSGRGRAGEDLALGGRFVVPQAALPTPAKGLVAWDAASATEVAGPLPGAEHGAFTWFLVGALRGWADGETDGKRDGSVSLDEASVYVARALRTVQVTTQRPVLQANDAGGSVLSTGGERGPDLSAVRRSVAEAGPKPAEPAPSVSAGPVAAVAAPTAAVAAPTAVAAPAAPPAPKTNGWEVAAAILQGAISAQAPNSADVAYESDEQDDTGFVDAGDTRPDTSGYAGRWAEANAGGLSLYVMTSLDGEVLADGGTGCITLLEPRSDTGPYVFGEVMIAGSCEPWSKVVLLPDGDRLRVSWWSPDGSRGTSILSLREAATDASPTGASTGYLYAVDGGDKVPVTVSLSRDTGTIDYLLNDCDSRISGLPPEGGWRPWVESKVGGRCAAGILSVAPLTSGALIAQWSLAGEEASYFGILRKE
ncbi:MAG: caspase family protein [Myxococcota bacterium]